LPCPAPETKAEFAPQPSLPATDFTLKGEFTLVKKRERLLNGAGFSKKNAARFLEL
jgi:hypothetical protein